MAQLGQRKCLCCRIFFDFDARNRGRQRYCSNAECRRASKAASQATWLAKPHNGGYFRDPVHVARVQAWRVAHPGYSRGKARPPAALQDPLLTQAPEKAEECPIRGEIAVAASPTALQDLLNAPTPVLAGLIAHLFQGTLQDDLAATTRRLVQLGHDVINNNRDEDSQESTAARAATPDKSYRSKDRSRDLKHQISSPPDRFYELRARQKRSAISNRQNSSIFAPAAARGKLIRRVADDFQTKIGEFGAQDG